MDLSGFLPPSDLLQKAQGVESGLKQRRRLGAIGWLGFILISAVQLWLEISKVGLISSVLEKGAAALLANWPLALLGVLTLFFLLLGTWSTFWLTESRQPFRYACFISSFAPISDKGASPENTTECMAWLPHDLTQLLNKRVQRFLFTGGSGDSGVTGKDEARGDKWQDSYVHIHGHYVVRARAGRQDELEIEVMPRVRMGSAGKAEVMAQSVVFPLPAATRTAVFDRRQYVDLLEQVYHSIVTELYRQLKEDVQRKIDLLPTSRFRAIALLYEADDYAHSNTLHAYEEARELYRQAASLADPAWRTPPGTRILRSIWRFQCKVHLARARLRSLESWYRPRVAESDLLCARALIGYARMMLFRRALAGLVGQTVNPIFEARPVVERAHDGVLSLSQDVPGRAQALFDAQVTLALARDSLGDTQSARELLARARAGDPQRAEHDATFIYASSVVSSNQRTRLGLLRRAVEMSPRFEVAQFSLAMELEHLWRSRRTLEESVANLVVEEYRKLLQINPGNLGAWANSGYVSWLLGSDERLEQALLCFEQGMRFKGIKRELFIAELDYGLARIHAERGDVVRAYQHYIAAASALLSREVDQSDFREYFFNPMNQAMCDRLKRYYGNVLAALRANLHADLRRSGGKGGRQEHKRVRDSIRAFALNDLGEAYLYSGNLKAAVKVLRRAVRCNPNYVLPYHNLGLFDERWLGRDPLYYLKRVIELQPSWPQGRLALARYYAKAAPDALGESALVADTERRIAASKQKLADLMKETRKRENRIRELEISLGAATAPGDVVSPSSPDREELDEEQSRLERELKEHQRKAQEKTELAKAYRDDAKELAQSLLPHAWLWKDSELDVRILRDSTLRAELSWERNFNDVHVHALYAWTLRFVYDPQATPRALQFLSHIREHYWPASTELLDHWLKLSLQGREVDQRYKKAKASDALSANPSLITQLPRPEELGFSDEELVDLLRRAIDFAPEHTDTPRLRRRLADLYIAMSKKADVHKAAALHRRAAHAAPDSARYQSALATALERAAQGGDLALLGEAVTAAERAVELEPTNTELSADARHLKEKLANAQRSQAAEREIEERFGPGALKLRVVERPVLVEFSGDLESAFPPATGAPQDSKYQVTLDNLNQGLFYELGVRFPPVEFRRSPDRDTKNHYTISLWGIPLVGGELRLDRWLFGAPPTILQAQEVMAHEAVNPANGLVASWVPRASLEHARKYADTNNIRYWDPFEYIVLHLAAVFRQHALDFLRVDDVLRLMRDWGLDDEAAQLDRGDLLIEFTNALRALVADQYRILYPEATVRAFREAYSGGKTLSAVVERMRAHPEVRKQNILHRSTVYTLIRVGPRFEAELETGLRAGQDSVLALEPKVAQKLLTAVRTFVRDLKDPAPFLLCGQRLRPWMRQLVALEFPHFRVVSESEALPEGIRHVKYMLDCEAD